jgi:hypothetical protein
MVMETIYVEPDGSARKPTSMGSPGNPAVGPKGSAEAQAWRSLRGAGPAPAGAGTPPAAPSGGALRAAGSAAKSVLRGAAPLAAAASAADTFVTPTEDYYTRFGFDPNQNRDGLTGLAKDVGVRALGAASDLGNVFTGGLAGRLYADKDPAARAAAGLAAQNPTLAAALGQQQNGLAPAAPNPGDLRLADSTAALPPGAPPQRSSVGSLFNNPNSTGTTTQLETIGVDGYQRQLQNLRGLGPAPAFMENGTLANAPGSTGFGGGTIFTQAGQNAAAQSVRDGLTGLRGGGPTRRERMQNAQLDSSERTSAAGRATQERIAQGQERLAGSRDALTLRGQDLDFAAAQARDATAQRGQDMTARSAATAARQDQMNKDRQFQLDTARFGEDKAKTMFSQREEGQKSFNGWAETLMTTRDEKGNTVVDKSRVADFTGLVSQTMGNMITRLQQKGDPASIKKAEELAQRGLGALDAEDRALLKTLYDRRERFNQTRGIGPFAAGGQVSNDLFDYQITGADDGVIQKRLRTAGGQSIGANDLRYTEPANALLPDIFKTPTNAYGPTLREQQGLR